MRSRQPAELRKRFKLKIKEAEAKIDKLNAELNPLSNEFTEKIREIHNLQINVEGWKINLCNLKNGQPTHGHEIESYIIKQTKK